LIDIISIIGLLVSLIAIVGGQLLEGGHIGSLLQTTAFLIVLGGTSGAIMLQSSPEVFLRGMKMLKLVFQPPKLDARGLIRDVLNWSQIARKGGLLALEPLITDQQHGRFANKGLQMLVDGAEPEMLREALELEIDAYDEHYRQGAKVWEAAGGYSPTIGILGAVMGLIHVMENLSDPSKLGGGIAVAFVATIYGVGAANLLFLPIGNKLKSIIGQEVMLKYLLIDGLVAIANGENTRVIESKLQGYLI
jgi:chemotaxis protein MotA